MNKKILCLIFSLAALAATERAAAQFTIDNVKTRPTSKEVVNHKDTVTRSEVSTEYFNQARYRAERAAIRKERNKFEFTASIQGTMTAYNDAWIENSGGDNAVAALAKVLLKHNYKKGKFTIDNKIDAKFGYNRMKVETTLDDGSVDNKGVWFKNQDEFLLETKPAIKFSQNWDFSSIIKFRSQFASGYKSRTEQELEHRKSAMFAPAYFDVSLGLTYSCPKKGFPIKINLAPLAMNSTFVNSELVRQNGYLYGLVSADKTSKWEGGSSVQIDFDRKWGKREWFRYRTTLYSFSGWMTNIGLDNKVRDYGEYVEAYKQWEANGKVAANKPILPIHPTVRWENTISLKASKYFTTDISFQLYYNRAQNLKVQTQTLLSVGLSYTFKNK
ncbi:MAG: DUF3078 domain-containing protein [Rikenellaceae bacterium]|nr:DUF3078 domain-containing protein [Rikenellaceae bacterium]MBQ5679010.1 DUF3078 domain-containing protein [Rikenellaceae bacterium]